MSVRRDGPGGEKTVESIRAWTSPQGAERHTIVIHLTIEPTDAPTSPSRCRVKVIHVHDGEAREMKEE
ncbi:MAG: hypothetical protein HQ495_09050 [Alphaproteobacteria bacterium]|nr:hypothetical protein [Alphaproteobacteria bacterium]